MPQRTIVLDLSVLATVSTSRGLGRYASTLALHLYQRLQTNSSLRLVGLADLPLIGPPQLSEDIPACIEALTLRAKRRTHFSWANRLRLQLGRAVTKAQADLVHLVDQKATPFTEVACPQVITCHHIRTKTSAAQWYGKKSDGSRSERRRIASARRIIAISRATAQELVTRLDLPLNKIDVVHNGILPERWSPEPQADDPRTLHKLNLNRDAYILCVGAINQ
ncbi:MAG: glycosyltransferase, partial [Polyangiaceae bacterium]|nr:glycosyltransferase [Polyangiaceae bacterium]